MSTGPSNAAKVAPDRDLESRDDYEGVRAQIVNAVRRRDEQDHLGLDELMRLLMTPLTSNERSD